MAPSDLIDPTDDPCDRIMHEMNQGAFDLNPAEKAQLKHVKQLVHDNCTSFKVLVELNAGLKEMIQWVERKQMDAIFRGIRDDLSDLNEGRQGMKEALGKLQERTREGFEDILESLRDVGEGEGGDDGSAERTGEMVKGGEEGGEGNEVAK